MAERTRERDRIWRLSHELMVVVQIDSTAAGAQPGLGATLGWQESELVGRRIEDLVHADDRAATSAERQAHRWSDDRMHFENRLRHRDGSYRPISGRRCRARACFIASAAT